jgi:PQQ-like domain
VFQTTWGAGAKNAAYGAGTDALGNIYVAGTTNLNLPPDYIGAHGTIFLLKFDPHGTLLWQRSWSGNNAGDRELGGNLAVDADGYSFVAATTPLSHQEACQGILLLKFDTNGNLVWQRTFASDCQLIPYGIALSQRGNIFLIALSDGPSLIKLDPAGNVMWSRTIEWGCSCEPRGVAVDGSENVVMSGDLVAKFNSTGSLIWEENLFVGLPTKTVSTYLSSSAVAFDNSGNIYTTGNGLILKLAPLGNVVWVKQWASNSYGAGLQVDNSNDIFLSGVVWPHTGSIANRPNPFLIKLDPNGSLLGQTVWEGAADSNDYGSGILTIDSQGQAYVLGAVSGKPPFGSRYEIDTMKNGTAFAGACNTTGCGLFPNIPAPSPCACNLWSYPVSSVNITSSSPNGTGKTLQGQIDSGGENDIFLLGYDDTQLSLAPNYFIPELVIGAAVAGAAIVATMLFAHRRTRRKTQLSKIEPIEPVKLTLPA